MTHSTSAFKLSASVLSIWLITLVIVGCSRQAAQIETPKVYDKELAAQYGKLTSQGYEALDQLGLDSAVAIFTRQIQLIPEGKWGYYNLACAYGRNAQVDMAFEWLTKAVDNGWDDPAHLQEDGDLATLRPDARFAPLVDRAGAEQDRREAMLAAGLPRYETPPMTFADEDALTAWADERAALLSANGAVWQNWQIVAARMDFEAQRLAAMRELKKDDPGFDYDLQRIIVMSRFRSLYDEKWGSLSKAIMSEADDYMSNHRDGDGRVQVAFRGGTAALMQAGVNNVSDPLWAADYARAKTYFAAVPEGSEYYGGAQAFLLAADMASNGPDRKTMYPRLKDFAAKFAGDENAQRVVSVFLHPDVIAALWPIGLNSVDVDGQPVTMDQYAGRVLLLDFWATWCGPCRGELPYIKAAYDKYHGQGFDIVSISLDYPQRTTTDDYRKWIKDNGMVWRHVYDGNNWKSPQVMSYYVSSIPSPYLIGKNGELVAMGDDCRGADLEKSIQKALGI